MLWSKAIGAGGAGGLKDPFFSDVGLLLHMDGPDGSNTFTDSSSYSNTINAGANAKVSSFSKFETGSLYSNGVNEARLLQPLATTSLGFGVGDFTVEFWIYCLFENDASYYGIFQLDSSNGQFIGMRFSDNGFSNKLQTITSSPQNGRGSTTSAFQGIIAWDIDKSAFTNTWRHVAFVAHADSYRLFVDGSEVFRTASTPASRAITPVVDLGASARFASIGYEHDSYFVGYIDEFRATKGVARYKSNFSPPTEPFYTP